MPMSMQHYPVWSQSELKSDWLIFHNKAMLKWSNLAATVANCEVIKSANCTSVLLAATVANCAVIKKC